MTIMSNRLNGARTTRRYVQVAMPHEIMEWQGWSAWSLLRYVIRAAQREGVDPARLEWRRCTETPIGITAVFEVV